MGIMFIGTEYQRDLVRVSFECQGNGAELLVPVDFFFGFDF